MAAGAPALQSSRSGKVWDRRGLTPGLSFRSSTDVQTFKLPYSSTTRRYTTGDELNRWGDR
jgi:hypothetical protein